MSIRAFRPRAQENSAVQQDPLLLTRLSAPPARSGLVERPRLFARLEAGLQRKLLLLTAPAGFGKTTLLSAWRATPGGAEWPLAWVSLTAGDNDPRRFWSYVLTAINGVLPGSGEDALAMLRPPENREPEAVLTELINALSDGTSCALVLDDYHLITTPAIHEAVAFLIEHMPPQLHLALIGQSDPPLPLARLRVRDQLVELHAADLRFTVPEATAFLNQAMGLQLAAADVAALEQRTEGWIAGLQLAALSLQGGIDKAAFLAAFGGGHHFVVEYLAAEVLSKQPAPLQQFLLQTAVLDRFTADLCDAVTGSANSRAMLEKLQRANLFLIPLDDQRCWYRYHNLFGDFLRDQLHLSGDGAAALHRRAAAWYEASGLPADALRHSLAAGDTATAARLIEENARALFMRGEVATVLGWLDALPAGMTQQRPQLKLVRAWALAYEMRLDEARHSLQWVAETAGSGAMGQELAGEIAAIRARLASYGGTPAETVEASQEALRILPAESLFLRSDVLLSLGWAYSDLEDHAASEAAMREAINLGASAGNLRVVMLATRSLGSLYFLRGELHKAAALFRETLDASEAQGEASPLTLGIVHAGLAEVLHERNEMAAALAHARRAVEMGKSAGDGKVLLHGYHAELDALQGLGDFDAAQESAERLVRVHAAGYYRAIQARLWLAMGDLSAAQGWALDCGLTLADEVTLRTEYELLTLACVRYYEGRAPETLDLLQRLVAAADAAGRYGTAVMLRSWQAVALWASGDHDGAIAALRPALELAAAEGHVEPFVEPGAAMIPVLRAIVGGHQASGAALAHIPRLLAALSAADAPEAAPRPIQTTALAEPLSDREIDVLRLIANGASNQDVAAALYVTVGTVKTHLKNLYGKLDVHSRTQAIARARELALI